MIQAILGHKIALFISHHIESILTIFTGISLKIVDIEFVSDKFWNGAILGCCTMTAYFVFKKLNLSKKLSL